MDFGARRDPDGSSVLGAKKEERPKPEVEGRPLQRSAGTERNTRTGYTTLVRWSV
jgi:hypothetical protein